MTPRPALPSEHGAIAALWHAGWHDGHAGHVPESLVRLRTLSDFERRVADLPGLRVIGPEGAPVGLCSVQEDELHQLYVAAEARGTGAAAALVADAEARLSEAHGSAFLHCAIGNRRARRFYERMGWGFARTETAMLRSADGPYPLAVARYEKTFTLP